MEKLEFTGLSVIDKAVHILYLLNDCGLVDMGGDIKNELLNRFVRTFG